MKASEKDLLGAVAHALEGVKGLDNEVSDNAVTGSTLTTDGAGECLIVFLSNGQSLKLRAELFGKPNNQRLSLMDQFRAGQKG